MSVSDLLGRLFGRSKSESAPPATAGALSVAPVVPPWKTDEESFEDYALRRRAFLQELGSAPIVEVVGVVGPNGPSGAKLNGERYWTANFNLHAWRVGDGPVHTKPLGVRKELVGLSLEQLQHQVRPYSVIHLRVHLSGIVDGRAEALLDRVMGQVSDADLGAIAAEMQEPVVLVDGTFGELTLDRRLGWYAATVPWLDGRTELCISGETPDETQVALKTAHAIWQNPADWDRKVRLFAVSQLLELKNDSWLGEDETTFTVEQFSGLMKLDGVSTYPDGSFEFSFEDGDLFWGHTIIVSGNLVEGPTDANIAG